MLFQRKSVAAAVAIGSAVLITACSSDLVKSLSGVNALRQKLIDKYGDQVTVNLHNSRYLQIVFVNSPLNKQDRPKRIERARETARFVAQNYEGIKSIDTVWISFLASETRFIVFHYTQGIDSFGFNHNGDSLDAQSVRDGTVVDDESPSDLRAPVAQYDQRTNETDISITRIQLEGDMDRGVVLVPHFTVTGDARQSGTVKSRPDFVVFDFAVYADQPTFHDTPALEVYCDDRSVWKGEASLVPTRDSGFDGTVGQFLSVHVSFKLFEQMANSRRVRIGLGSKQFELLPEDISALKKMTAYVPIAKK
jgi:hypothetical protein